LNGKLEFFLGFRVALPLTEKAAQGIVVIGVTGSKLQGTPVMVFRRLGFAEAVIEIAQHYMHPGIIGVHFQAPLQFAQCDARLAFLEVALTHLGVNVPGSILPRFPHVIQVLGRTAETFLDRIGVAGA
jgi:hypothetical protein